MTPQSEALELVLTALNEDTDYNIIIGALPQDCGVTAEITGGEPKGMYLDLEHGKTDLTVLFLSKSESQTDAYDMLCDIGNRLDRYSEISGDTVKVINAGVRSGAGLVGKEGDFYIYSLIARISIYF